jgi:hypothetical protein
MLLKRQSEARARVPEVRRISYKCLFRCIGSRMLLKRQSEARARVPEVRRISYKCLFRCIGSRMLLKRQREDEGVSEAGLVARQA